MKNYYVHYYKNFANTYNLYHAETPEEIALLPENSEKITRKEAEHLCAAEHQRRKSDYNFSGYADTMIYPADYNPNTEDYINQPQKFYVDGYIVTRK